MRWVYEETVPADRLYHRNMCSGGCKGRSAPALGGRAAKVRKGADPGRHPIGSPLGRDRLWEENGRRVSSCAVRKDAGDDPDVTDGLLIFAQAELEEEPGVMVRGGRGVGRVTLPGLSVPVGEAAINPVPRSMICDAVLEAAAACGYTGGFRVTISVPQGEEIARKTFNPRLGIEGGISILGTTGIVKPMSEAALLESIRLEIRQQLALGREYLTVSPGNMGASFLSKRYGMRPQTVILCSNYVGDTIDMALEEGAKGILFGAHFGKFIKVAGGIMNTHSHQADSRMEILCAAVIRAGGSLDTARKILSCRTTTLALQALQEEGILECVMEQVAERIQFYLDHRSYEEILLGAVLFSEPFGYLGETAHVKELLEKCRDA